MKVSYNPTIYSLHKHFCLYSSIFFSVCKRYKSVYMLHFNQWNHSICNITCCFKTCSISLTIYSEHPSMLVNIYIIFNGCTVFECTDTYHNCNTLSMGFFLYFLLLQLLCWINSFIPFIFKAFHTYWQTAL